MLVFTDCEGVGFSRLLQCWKRGTEVEKLKCCKLSVLTEIQLFFLDVCFLECCKPLVNFQSSEKVISDNVARVLSASVEERGFGVLGSLSPWQHFLMLHRGCAYPLTAFSVGIPSEQRKVYYSG